MNNKKRVQGRSDRATYSGRTGKVQSMSLWRRLIKVMCLMAAFGMLTGMTACEEWGVPCPDVLCNPD